MVHDRQTLIVLIQRCTCNHVVHSFCYNDRPAMSDPYVGTTYRQWGTIIYHVLPPVQTAVRHETGPLCTKTIAVGEWSVAYIP